MADEAPKQAEEKAKQKQDKPKSNMLMLIVVISVIVIVNGILAFAIIMATAPGKKTAETEQESIDSTESMAPTTTEIGTIHENPIVAIVNIAGTDGERFLKIGVRIEYDEKEYKNIVEVITRREPQLKNMLINQLSQLTLVELNEPDAKNRIRKEFVQRVNSSLPEKAGKISNVYLDQFIIQ
ncbi:MAG: hypothetical protein GF398_10795 [Chitinivibrionales bacterium]|nr:hypothetical protein [Chitinivibrionales bacterium]